MNDNQKRLPIPQIVIIIGTVISISYLIYIFFQKGGKAMDIGGQHVDIASIVAIVIALLSIAGGIWIQILQFKKDSGKIADVKSDTSEIKPKTANIDDNVKKIRDDVIEIIKPNIVNIAKSSDGINVLVNELEFQKRLKSEFSTNIENKDYFISGLEKLYEENAELKRKVKDLEYKLEIEVNKNRKFLQVYYEQNKSAFR